VCALHASPPQEQLRPAAGVLDIGERLQREGAAQVRPVSCMPASLARGGGGRAARVCADDV
jgi:hypothetical protein